MRAQFVGLSCFSLLLLAAAALAQGAAPWHEEKTIDAAVLSAEIDRAAVLTKALAESRWPDAAAALGLEKIPEAGAEDWKKAVEARETALRVLAEVLEDARRLKARDVPEIERQAGDALKRLADLRAQAPATPAEFLTEEELGAQEDLLVQLESDLGAAEKTLETRREAMRALAEEDPALVARQAEIRQKLAESDPAEVDPASLFRRETLGIELRQVKERLAFVRLARPVWEKLEALRTAERDLAKMEVERQRAYTALARDVLRGLLADEVKRLKKEAEQKRREADRPGLDPETRKALILEADTLTARAGVEADSEFLQTTKKLLATQRSENEALAELWGWAKERFGDSSRVSGRAASLLLDTLRRVKESRVAREKELVPALSDDLDRCLNDRAEVSDDLREITEDQVELRKLLAERREQLDEVLVALRELDGVYAERKQILDAAYPFVISRIYRVQSQPPLGLKTLGEIRDELKRVAKVYTGPELRSAVVREAEAGVTRFVLVAAVAILLIGTGIFLIRRLSSYHTRWNYRGGPFLVGLQRIGSSLLLSAVAPACLVLAALLVDVLDLPPLLSEPVAALLYAFAAIFFARRFLWALFREDGVAVKELGTLPDVAKQLLAVSRWVTAGLLALALPWWILTKLPLEPALLHTPRVVYTVLLVYFAVIFSRLLRRNRPLISTLTGRSGFWYQSWFFVWPILTLCFFAIILMDVLGYRYGSRFLAENAVLTLLAGFVLVGLYNLITRVVEEAANRVRSRLRRELGAKEGRAESDEVLSRVTRFVGVTATILAVVVLARFWGFTSGLESVLSSVGIVRVDAEAGIDMTLWDLATALAWIAGAHFLIKHLPALYEMAIFHRLEKMETGTRFVIIAVSKYVILLVAYSAAFLALRLSFKSLGYVVAALSVGIGFGLQEIISNFVSGLILLIERPIRVGDIVSVGSTLGQVERINIRATEIIDFDRQVIIVPNRNFITEQVTNWTHNDQIVRSTIDVGVAYGSDVEKVAKILMEIVQGHPSVLKKPEPRVLFMALGDSSLNFIVRPFTLIADKLDTKAEILSEITRRFAAEGIEIPFPQRDLHLKSIDDETLLGTLAASLPKKEE